MTSPITTHDLLPSEMVFVAAMQQLGFGRFEYLQIRGGELLLDPWPTTIRDIKFATPTNSGKPEVGAAELRLQIAEFFEYVRSGDVGEIRILEIRHGLPFAMEVELAGVRARATVGCCRG
jgi:hypothetical protein